MAFRPECLLERQGYRIGQAAKALGINIHVLRYWMDRGKIPGLRRTAGGHRWITREGFLRFAKMRGAKELAEERRRAPRVQLKNIRLRLRTSYKGQKLLLGEGRLINLSRTGFRMDRVAWVSPLVPAIGTRITFEVPHKGIFKGVAGQARVAWSRATPEEKGASLGVRLQGLDSKNARHVWESTLASGSAN